MPGHEQIHASDDGCTYPAIFFSFQQAVYEHQRNLHPFQYLATKQTQDDRVNKLRHFVDAKKPKKRKCDVGGGGGGGDHVNPSSEGENRDDTVVNEDDSTEGSSASQTTRPVIACHLCDEKVSDKKDYEDHVIRVHGGDAGNCGGGGGGNQGETAAKEEAYFKKCPICSKSEATF